MKKQKSKKATQAVTKKPAKIILATQEKEESAHLSPLMPDLEEVVKKNPNRLIGCGG